MNMTGNCKQDFEEWLDGQAFQSVKGESSEYDWNDVFDLEQLPVSMQFGIIQEWADSVGIDVSVYRAVYSTSGFHYMVSTKIRGIKSDYPLIDREAAQLAAIANLNRIYNER